MSTDQKAEPPTVGIPVRVFLNYASEDREHALWLHDRLMKAGLQDVWLDRSDIKGGDQWKREIDRGLRQATVLLALLTENSIDPSRQWVEYERSEARRLFKPIIPLRFDADPPAHLSHLHYVDFSGDMEAALLALLSAIGEHTLHYTSRPPLPDEPPGVLDAFVGRERELGELFELLNSPRDEGATARQSVAVQGMGGQGKTMLAEELIRRIAPRYPGGLLLERRGQSPLPARVVLQKWATLALGAPPPREYQPADVRSLLGGYGELLVLIDDVSESDFDETKLLLEALPADATRLLTTRSLDIEAALGCRIYPLHRLKDDDARKLVRKRLHDRTGALTKPEDSEEQDAAIRRLVALVQGHALALELTAARCDFPEDLPDVVEELADSLAEGVDDMAVDLAHAPQKDDSLAVSLNISFEQLREHDRAKGTDWAERFAALGVFPDSGRMNSELIAAVWGDAGERDRRTSDALKGLYRRAMIKREPESRLYHAHPLLRAFARSLLRKEPERMAAAQLRYRNFLTCTAEQGFREREEQWSRMRLYTPHFLHTAAELWAECKYLLGDLDALARPEAPAAAVTLTDPAARDAALRAMCFIQAVMDYVLHRPGLGETGRRLLTLGLACVRSTGSEELLDMFVRALGVWYARSDPRAAESYFEEALRWAEHIGDRAEQGKVLSAYGELQRGRSRLDHAVELLDRALATQQELGDPYMQAATLKSLGETYWRRCEFDTAMNCYQRALDVYRDQEDRSGQADLLNKVGSVEFNRGNYEEAISYFEQALPMHQELRNRSMEGEDLNDMGISYNYLGQPEHALPLLEKAIDIHGRLGNRRLEAIARSNHAAAFYALGRYDSAMQEARKARAIAREIECKFTEVWALNWEALAHQELGRPELALPLLAGALDLLDETFGPRERVGTWGNLGYLLGKHLGRPEHGTALLTRAIELMRGSGFTRAFGGRTLGDLEALVHEINR